MADEISVAIAGEADIVVARAEGRGWRLRRGRLFRHDGDDA